MSLTTALLWVHAGVTTALAGLIWTVQIVVYPGLRTVGASLRMVDDSEAWPRVHAAHTRTMAAVVGPPWAVQGLCVAALLVLQPSPLVLITAALAATTVGLTVALSVPLHTRLAQGYDDALARRLVRTNWWRTAAWSAGAVCALVLAAQGSP